MPNGNGGSYWIRPEKRLAIYARDDFTCLYCGERDTTGKHLTLDHLAPRELGGSNETKNLITCCFSDNSARRHLSLRAWFAKLRARGVNTNEIRKRIRRHIARRIDISEGRLLLQARKGQDNGTATGKDVHQTRQTVQGKDAALGSVHAHEGRGKRARVRAERPRHGAALQGKARVLRRNPSR